MTKYFEKGFEQIVGVRQEKFLPEGRCGKYFLQCKAAGR